MPVQMGFYDAVEKMAHDAGLTLADVGRNMGRSPSYVTGNRARGSLPKVDNAAAIVRACGWALVAVPRDGIPADALEIGAPSVDAEDAERRALERKRNRLRRELEATEELLG